MAFGCFIVRAIKNTTREGETIHTSPKPRVLCKKKEKVEYTGLGLLGRDLRDNVEVLQAKYLKMT